MFPLEERRKLWAWHYAHLSFTNCRNCCEFLLKEKLTSNHPIYYGLTTSVYVLYARPFVKSYGLEKLSETIVPENEKPLHEHLLRIRSKLYAHVDISDPAVFDGLPAVDVRVKILKVGFMELEALEAPPLLPGFEKILALTDELLKKCQYHSQKIVKRYKSDIPQKPGTYHVNLKDEHNAFTLDPNE